MITILLTGIHIVVCFILILVILLQAGRGQGLAGPSFSSGNVQSLLGTQAADFLTKATSVSAICFLFTCIGLNYMESQKSRSLFQPGRHQQGQQPLDLDAIQKALEKIKSENAGSAVPGQAGTPAKAALPGAPPAASKAPAPAASAPAPQPAPEKKG